MGTKRDKLDKILVGIAGEYFVAAELSRHNFIAAVTLRNTRGIDILVSRRDGKKTATIQVKTMRKHTRKWLLSRSDEKSKGDNHYYVFVVLNGGNEHPEYHIVKGDTVAKRCKEDHDSWLKGKKQGGGKRKDTTMRAFRLRRGDDFRNRWGDIKI